MICDRVYTVYGALVSPRSDGGSRFDDTQERIDKQTALFKKIEEKLTRLERAKRVFVSRSFLLSMLENRA